MFGEVTTEPHRVDGWRESSDRYDVLKRSGNHLNDFAPILCFLWLWTLGEGFELPSTVLDRLGFLVPTTRQRIFACHGSLVTEPSTGEDSYSPLRDHLSDLILSHGHRLRSNARRIIKSMRTRPPPLQSLEDFQGQVFAFRTFLRGPRRPIEPPRRTWRRPLAIFMRRLRMASIRAASH